MADDRKWMKRFGNTALTAEPEDGTFLQVDRHPTHVTLTMAGDDAMPESSAVLTHDEYRQWLAAQARYLLGEEIESLPPPTLPDCEAPPDAPEGADDDIPF